MKYTRYDLKKDKGTGAFIFMLALILAAAFIIGTITSKIFLSNNNTGEVIQNTVSHNSNEANNGKTVIYGYEAKFMAIQGGMYKDKNNSDEEKKYLSNYGTPFSIDDNGKVRVFLGIYTVDNAKNIIDSLKKQKVDNSHMDFIIKKDSLCNIEIAEIVSANLQILNKFSDKNVEYIKTSELKKWCMSLKEVDKNSENFHILENLKNHTKNLKNNIPRNESEENYMYIYNRLKSLK